MNQNKKYPQKISEIYGQKAQNFSNYFNKPHEFLATERNKFLATMPHYSTILDCGCGPGQDTELFTNLGLEVFGVDITPEFLNMAKKRAPQAHFIQADMRHLPFSSASFDGIWLSFSLLHIRQIDVPQTLGNLKRILKINGKIMIAVHRGPKTAWVTTKISGIDHPCYVQEWVQAD